MALPDVNDADILRAVGLTVTELPGWQGRGEADGGFAPIAVLFHHDAMELSGNSDPSDDLNVPKYMSQQGVDGSQKWVGRQGVWVMLAAGRKWHAGKGIGWGRVGRDQGNSMMDGLETDHTVPGQATYQPWTAVQLASINLGVAALCRAHGYAFTACCGHKEYTRDTGRKVDPEGIDLDAWRITIAQPISVLQAAYNAAGGTLHGVITVDGTSHSAPPAAPLLDRNLLEIIMTLPGAPTGLTYPQLINDIANKVLASMPLDDHDKAVIANNLSHKLNADGSKK